MKKLFMLSIFAATLQFVTAQDYKKVQNAIILGRVEDAKTEIDKLAADPKAQAKAETYMFKGKIYAAIFKTPELSAKYANAGAEAEAALKKYQEMDPTYAIAKEKDGLGAYFDMYFGFITRGTGSFNDKDWANAGENFATAIRYIDQIIENKWTSNNLKMDTTSILYAAYAFQNAKKLETAAGYYQRLADNKISDTNFVDVYRFLLDYYSSSQKDEVKFKKNLALANEVFPDKSKEWEYYEMDLLESYDLKTKTEMYDKEDAAGTLTENKYLLFGESFANAKNKDDLDSATAVKYSNKSIEAFKKAFAKNSNNAIAAFNVGVVSYNTFATLDDLVRDNIRSVQRINAEKPVEKDPKKKAAVEAKAKAESEPYLKANAALEPSITQQVDQAIEWLQKAYAILKDKSSRTNNEKSVINRTVDWLANLYAYKRDRARGKDNAAFDAFEAKYKEFDALHNKF
ncbi:MAG: hypothetical protein U1C70_10630 [Sediminibacterium sp.]|uniref:hypothetical protein n=1 Tax=Sediminibacterium sp. TaxID=1917865 RepID=UPI002AB8E5E7|nr:hypothetical protein [Sediminibacterium sp.]MDZ4072271.1 hypothetical protein [Sediminibacterium sp.]